LINLILGVELLPFSILSTTSTICEIKYGERPKLYVHYAQEDGKPKMLPKTVELQEFDVCGKSYREQIDPYVHRKKDREKRVPYEKVEIFWPHELLKVN
jgi:receptor-interacting serine/threonine-protein kinase 5